MNKTGAQVILEKLIEHGVKHVFEFPGGSICPILDELSRSKRITLITTRHEQAAIHAADGYARVTKKPGVCMATSGPGASNLVTGIANAFMDSVPLVIITGQVAEWDLKKERLVRQRGFQELDIISVVKSITKAAFLVKKVSELPALIDKAFFLAQAGRPGPVLIDIPINLQYTVSFIPQRSPVLKEKRLACSQQAINRIIRKLIFSRRPLLIAGGGITIAGAEKELGLLLRRYRLPVVQTLMGLTCVPSDYPLSLGLVGYAGSFAANSVLKEADLVLGLGTRFDNRAFPQANKDFAADAFLIHVDCDQAELNHRVRVDVPVYADVKEFLRRFARMLEGNKFYCSAEWEGRIKGLLHGQKQNDVRCKKQGIAPQEVLTRLSNLLRHTPHVVTTDVGQHQLWTAQHFKFSKPNTLLTSGGLGTMGFGLPAAIGAQKALPGACVVVISSDGSIQMNIQELATIKDYRLPIKIIVFNNKCLGLVRQIQEFAFDGRFACTRVNKDVDFVKIAKAYGIEGVRIATRKGLSRILHKIIASKKSILAEIMIDEFENVYPVRVKGKTIYSHGTA